MVRRDRHIRPLQWSIFPPALTLRVDIKMTLTAPGCGMGASIAADAEVKLGAIDGVGAATVEIVWDPPWRPQMISDEGREQLGIDVAR